MATEFHVSVQFAAGGPAVTGTWTDRATALGKFRGWVGSHGSVPGVIITLREQAPQGQTELRSWMTEKGEIVHE